MSNTATSAATTTLDSDTTVSELLKHVQALTNRVDEFEQQLAEKDQRIDALETHQHELEDELEQQVEETADSASEAKAHSDAVARKTQTCSERVDELQSRELEKGAHLLADNVDPDRIAVDGSALERITKDDGKPYYRLPGENDALERGGAVAHSTADLLPIQRFARYDDEMLASVTNRKPDELAGKALRERDDADRYSLWSNGSSGIRAYLDASDLAEWIRLNESG